jgi:DedD protein
MDEQVKARLIGATVLVVIAVALVPELLSGPKRAVEAEPASEGSRGMRTVTIDLGGDGTTSTSTGTARPATVSGSAGEGTRPSTIDAPGAAANVPAGAEPPAAAIESPEIEPAAATVADNTPVVAPPAAVASKPAPQAATPTQASAAGGWTVQVGAFSAAATARKLVADLGRDGMPAYVAPLERGGKTLHRVRVGPVASKAAAEQLAARLKTRGLPGSIVAPD